MDRVRCGIIGAGNWATIAHIPAIRNHPQADLVALHTLDAGSARQMARDFEVPIGTSSVEELLSIKDLDAVIVSSTQNVHYEQTRSVLERGLHVLCEKPLTLTVAQAEEIVQLADRQGVQFVVSCPWNFTPHAQEAKKLIQSGKLGRLKMINILQTNFVLDYYKGRSYSDIFANSPNLQNPQEVYIEPGQLSLGQPATGKDGKVRSHLSDPKIGGGGQVYSQVSHIGAYLGLLTGVEPVEIFARFENAGLPVDVYNAINMKLADGTLVSLGTHGATMMSERNYEIRVYGTEGMILLELWKGKMEFHDMDCNVQRFPDIPEAEIYPMFAPAENLVDVVLGKAENISPGHLGLYAMKVIEGACESVKTNRNVILTS
jgi:predicted dehydrogenase